MSYPQPWILGNTIISDGLDWHAAEWGSTLRGWQGLPRAQVILSERYGTWPRVSGLRRPGRRISLETHFLQLLEVNRKLARKVYLKAIDYEEETPYRLLCADFTPPNCSSDKALLALGPLNVQTDGEGNWTLRDLIDPDSVEATITGAVHFAAGSSDGLRAIVIEETEINYILNPSFEVNVTDGWTNDAGDPFNTFARVATLSKFGNACLHCISDATADNAYSDTVADADGGETWTASCWIYLISGDVRLRIQENNVGWWTLAVADADTGLLNQWQKISVTEELSPGATDGRIQITPIASAVSEFYVDGVDFVEASYVSTHIDGSLGPGYSWTVPTSHNDTSTRTETVIDLDDQADTFSDLDTMSFRVVLMPQYDYDDAAWPQASNNPVFDIRGADNNNRIYCYFLNTSNAFVVYINGAARLEPAAVAFEKDDRLELVITLDFASDSYKLYLNGTLIDTDTTVLTAPTAVVDWKLGAYYTETWQSGWAIEQYQVFNKVFSQTEVTLMNGKHLNARWIDVLCDQTDPLSQGGKETTLGFVATLALDDDVRFRSRDGDAYFMGMYDASWDLVIDVATDDLVRPVFYVTPEAAKTGGFLYKAWYPVLWTAPKAAANYPTGIIGWDTSVPVAAGKMQADGDDLRIYIDGVEADRWLDAINTAATNVWFNVDFEADIVLTLDGAMLVGDTVTYLDVVGDISRMPTIGIVLIDSEAFAYNGKLVASNRLQNVVRAARGTAAAGHADVATASWIQHDIWAYYGDATLTVPTVDGTYEPIIEPTNSTNAMWRFEEFGSATFGRTGARWVFEVLIAGDSPDVHSYTGNRDTTADPYESVGIYIFETLATPGQAHWYFYHPVGIARANVSSAEARYDAPTWDARVRSSPTGADWTTEYVVPGPGGWNAWSDDINPVTAGAYYLELYLLGPTANTNRWNALEIMTVDIYATDAPVGTLSAEQTNYAMELTITNDATSKTLALAANVNVDDIIEIDTNGKVAWNLTENVNLSGKVVQTDGIRRDWLKLIEGENTLTFADATAASIAVEVVYDRRLYE